MGKETAAVELVPGHMTVTAAIERVRVHPVLFRWVVHVLAIQAKRCASARLYTRADVERIEEYLLKHDPDGEFETQDGKGAGRRPGK